MRLDLSNFHKKAKLTGSYNTSLSLYIFFSHLSYKSFQIFIKKKKKKKEENVTGEALLEGEYEKMAMDKETRTVTRIRLRTGEEDAEEEKEEEK